MLLFLLVVAYPIVYAKRAKQITGRTAPKIFSVFLEGSVFVIVSTVFASLAFLPLSTGHSSCRLRSWCSTMRFAAHIKPIQEQQAAAERKAKQETIIALAPLLDTLHGTYGQYADLADSIPAAWYQPRKHYIAYMASLLYHFHNEHGSYNIKDSGITRDSHPLYMLRYLPFPGTTFAEGNLSDPEHPYNYLMRVITDTAHPDHIVFRDLIPAHVDLLPYLQARRWQQPLSDHARDLAGHVEQGIIANQGIIIGRPTESTAQPYPVFYRDSRFRHSYIIGKTGSGKSTLLRNLITQDLHHGNGVIVLSPENDLFEKLLAFIPAATKRRPDLFRPHRHQAARHRLQSPAP